MAKETLYSGKTGLKIQRSCQDLNSGTLKYKSVMLENKPRRSPILSAVRKRISCHNSMVVCCIRCTNRNSTCWLHVNTFQHPMLKSRSPTFC